MWTPNALFALPLLLPGFAPEWKEQTFPDETRIEFQVARLSDGSEVRHGDYRLFAADGTQRVAGEYEDGERSGRWTYYDAEGKTWILGKFAKDQRHGSWSIRGEGNRMLAKGKYKWGVPTGKWELQDSAGVEREGVFEWESNQDKDGNLSSEGTAFDGRKHGRWTFYWPNGRRQMEAHFRDGARSGTWHFWHSDGTLDPAMLREQYGSGWAVAPEFYVDPVAEYVEEPVAAVAIQPRFKQLLPVEHKPGAQGTRTELNALQTDMANLLGKLLELELSSSEAWQAAQDLMLTSLDGLLCGHRLLSSTASPGPETTGLAILRLHSLYQLAADSPGFWLVDINYANHGTENDTCPLLLHPPFRAAGLGEVANADGPYATRFQQTSVGPKNRGRAALNESVELALQWLVDNQEAEGAWLAGESYYSAGVTGLALLALLGNGNSLHQGPHQESVRRGVCWLLERTHRSLAWKPNPKRRPLPESVLGPEADWMNINTFQYTLAIMTEVYCELATIDGGPFLRQLAQDHIDLCLKYRNPYAVWGYELAGEDINNTSLTGWMVAAMVAGERAGLRVDPAYRDDTLAWLDKVTELMFGRAGYRGRDQMSSRARGVNEEYPRELTEALTASALHVRFVLGQDPEEVDVMERSADTMLRNLPQWDAKHGYTNDCYYWYFGSYAMQDTGGRHLLAWNKALHQALLENQEKGKDEYGSWKNNGPWGSTGGRVYTTALLALSLEAPFRYARADK